MESLLQYLYEQPASFGKTSDFRSFYEDMASSESGRVEGVWRAVVAVNRGDPSRAAAEAEAIVRAMPDDDDEHGALALRTFAEAVLERLSNQSGLGGNLYLDARPPGAQLRAFELMRLRTPLIPFAYAAANRALMNAFENQFDHADVTIIDVGIGRGGQLKSLIRNPKLRRRLRSLHIIGIEPDSSTSGGALQWAEQDLLKAGKSVGLEVTFAAIAKRGEDLVPEDIFAAAPRGLVVGNAALALHHTLGDDDDLAAGRRRVLKTLYDCEVQQVVLVEPDSNHSTDDVSQRFLYAYRHYRSVARSLRSQLGAADAQLVWQEFFAPEVRNVIAHEGRQRTERHEESASWLEHLKAAGWTPAPLQGLLPQAAAPDGFQVRDQGAAFTLRYQNVSLLSVVSGKRSD